MTGTRDGRDIVERLRHAPIVVGAAMFDATGLLEDAASEIERLRSQRVAVPEGWTLVPVEPTWAMQIAGRDAILDEDDSIDFSTGDARFSYVAMLSAAPSPAISKATGEK